MPNNNEFLIVIPEKVHCIDHIYITYIFKAHLSLSLHSISFTRFTIHYLNTHTQAHRQIRLVWRWTTAPYNIIIIIIIVAGADDFVCFCCHVPCLARWLLISFDEVTPCPSATWPLLLLPLIVRQTEAYNYNCLQLQPRRACMKSPSEKLLEQTLTQVDNNKESFKINKLTAARWVRQSERERGMQYKCIAKSTNSKSNYKVSWLNWSYYLSLHITLHFSTYFYPCSAYCLHAYT